MPFQFQPPQAPPQFVPIDLSQMGVYTVSNEEAVRRQQLTANNNSKPQQQNGETTPTNFAIPLERLGAYTVAQTDLANRGANNNNNNSDLKNETDSDPFRAIPLENLGVYTVRGDRSRRPTTESPLLIPTGPIALTDPDGVEDGNGTLSVITVGESALNGTNATIVANHFVESNDTVSTTIPGFFDCRRDGHECHSESGICNLDNGKCECNAGYSNFDCGVSGKEHTLI